MMRTFFLVALLSTACVDQTGQNDPATSQASQELGKGVDMRTEPWNPLIANNYSYWPTGAVHVQVFSLNGDDDGTGHPTSYVYIVGNGSVISHVFRLLKSDLISLNDAIDRAANPIEQQNPFAYHINTTGGWGGAGPHSPPQPGGDGQVVTRAWFNQIILDRAATMGGAVNNIIANMNTPNYRNGSATAPKGAAVETAPAE